jgi:hypothetical protein
MIADPEGPSFIVRTVGRRQYSDGAFVTHDPRRTSDAWSLGAKSRTLGCGMGVSDEKSFKVRYRRR